MDEEQKRMRMKALDELSRLDQELGMDDVEWPESRELDGLKLVCTCGACPEQYEVFDGDRQVGYLRLRHGRFRADCPSVGGETVYHSNTKGDGVFAEEERDEQLGLAIKKIREWMVRNETA
jgi:hypothetical protein